MDVYHTTTPVSVLKTSEKLEKTKFVRIALSCSEFSFVQIYGYKYTYIPVTIFFIKPVKKYKKSKFVRIFVFVMCERNTSYMVIGCIKECLGKFKSHLLVKSELVIKA